MTNSTRPMRRVSSSIAIAIALLVLSVVCVVGTVTGDDRAAAARETSARHCAAASPNSFTSYVLGADSSFSLLAACSFQSWLLSHGIYNDTWAGSAAIHCFRVSTTAGVRFSDYTKVLWGELASPDLPASSLGDSPVALLHQVAEYLTPHSDYEVFDADGVAFFASSRECAVLIVILDPGPALTANVSTAPSQALRVLMDRLRQVGEESN